MLKQPEIEFPSFSYPSMVSDAPINAKKFSGDNLKVYNALLSGRIINRTSIDMQNLTLHSRISDLKNKYLIPGIKDEFMNITIQGKEIRIKKYWMAAEEIQKRKAAIS